MQGMHLRKETCNQAVDFFFVNDGGKYPFGDVKKTKTDIITHGFPAHLNPQMFA